MAGILGGSRRGELAQPVFLNTNFSIRQYKNHH